MSEFNFNNGAMREYSADRDKRLRRAIRREWQEAGYRPDGHLVGLVWRGDVAVLRDMHQQEQRAARVGSFPLSAWLAGEDIGELRREIHRLGSSAYRPLSPRRPLTRRPRAVIGIQSMGARL